VDRLNREEVDAFMAAAYERSGRRGLMMRLLLESGARVARALVEVQPRAVAAFLVEVGVAGVALAAALDGGRRQPRQARLVARIVGRAIRHRRRDTGERVVVAGRLRLPVAARAAAPSGPA
jgi:hypothetical protein